MTEQQFEVFRECEYLEEWSSCPYCIKYDGETVFFFFSLGIAKEVCKKLNEQQAIIDMQELRLQQLEELLELSENLNKSYREKLIDMNLKMMIDDE